ncbi:unnamed protein product, partial [marine sediment metagenome]
MSFLMRRRENTPRKAPAIHPVATAVLLALGLVASGCPPDAQAPGMDGNPAEGPEAAATRPAGKPVLLLLVQLRIVTFEVPVGSVSASEQLWVYLDEEPVGVRRGVSLGRNGIRIGVTPAKNWDDLAAVLKRMHGRRAREVTVIARPGRPKTVVLKAKQPSQRLFVFYDDLTLSGAEYPPGDNVLQLAFALDEDDPSRVHITGLPQIRSAARRPRLVRKPGHVLIAKGPDLFSFQALTFQMAVGSEDIVVIGPS